MPLPTKETLAAGKMENCFRDASDHIERYLVDGAAGMSGPAPIAIFHLICRSLADLRSAQYLASSGFPIQFDEVGAEIQRALAHFKVPEREQQEVLGAIVARKGEVVNPSP